MNVCSNKTCLESETLYFVLKHQIYSVEIQILASLCIIFGN